MLAHYLPFDEPVSRNTYTPPGWNSQNAIAEISKDVYDTIVALGAEMIELEAFDAQSLAQAAKDKGLLLDASVTAAIAAGSPRRSA